MSRIPPLIKNYPNVLRNVLIFGFLFNKLSLVLQAQTVQCPVPRSLPDEEGGFTLNVYSGCVGLNVRIETQDPDVKNPKYFFALQGGDYKKYNNVPSTRTDTTYNKPGKYIVIQLGSKGGTASFACQQVEVFDTPKPTNVKVSSCSPRQLTVTILDQPAFKYDYYNVIWDASNPNGTPPARLTPGQSANFTYPNSNPRQIRVIGFYNGVNCSGPSDPITVNPSGPNPTAPRITRLEVTGSNTVRLDYSTPQPGAFLDIYRRTAGGTFAKIVPNVGGLSQAIQNPSDQTTQYCYQVRNADDGCATPPLQSAELCTIPLQVTPQNKQNQVQWTPHPAPAAGINFLQYDITKNGIQPPYRTTRVRTESTLTDTDVDCGRQYSYQVTARINAGSYAMESISLPVAVVAINNTPPPPITDVFVSVGTDGKIELNWIQPTNSPVSRLFTINRATGNSGDFKTVGTAQTNRFTDAVAPETGPYCYTISYQDLCSNNATPSQPVCSIALSQRTGLLNWSSQSPFLENLQGYFVREVDEQGNQVGPPVNVGTQTSYQIDLNSIQTQQARFQVAARSARGVLSFSNVVLLDLAMRLWIPDAFSPNGDGINDTFLARGLFLQTFRMTVFNRWGEPLYRTDSADQGWDGTYNGQALGEGTYVYAVEATDSRGARFVKRGSFLLLR
jgi:gliding motility-associated-like protein